MFRRVLPLAALLALPLAPPVTAQEAVLESSLAQFSYALGSRMGARLREQGLEELDSAAFAEGFRHAVEGTALRLSPEEMQGAAMDYQQTVAARQSEQAAENLAAGEAFLAENRGRAEVEELASGVQYRVIESGSGRSPTVDDTVIVHYRGWLLDGTEFDSSYSRGEPTEVGLGRVIEGWKAALPQMSEGAHWEVWIPAGEAYGEQGAPGAIGPNQTLRFEIQLLEVKEAG